MSSPASQPLSAASSTAASVSLPTGLGAGSQLLAEFPDYAGAQRLVDQLSDEGFPVEHVRIVGTGIHSVEQVTGRLTTGRAALAGAASGAWFGLLVGLLFGLFTVGPAWLFLLFWGLVIGALFGAVFGFLAHAMTGGRRDFSSVKGLQAQSYSVYVDASVADRAREVAGRAAPGGR